jgi:hypothetical protein
MIQEFYMKNILPWIFRNMAKFIIFMVRLYIVVAIVMVNSLNAKNIAISIENFAVSVSREVSGTKSISRDLSRLVSIPYILHFSNFAIAK